MKLALAYLSNMRDDKPPLGLASMATYAEKEGFSNIIIIDSMSGNIEENIIKEKPALLGISSMTFQYADAINLAIRIRKKMNIPIFIGGTHISLLPNSFNNTFDFGIIGEGEQTLTELLKLFTMEKRFTEEKLMQIKGLVFYRSNKIYKTEPRPLITPLDKIPIINRKFLNLRYFKKQYSIGIGKQVKEATLITSRGCPYKCIFCATSSFWGSNVRFHSAKHILDEISSLIRQYNVSHFDVWDDLFTINKQRLRELAKLIKSSGLSNKFTISCQARANLVDQELCDILKSINVKSVSIGFESGSDKVLRLLKGNNVTVQDNRNSMKILKRNGFRVLGSLIFGSPTETIDDMKKTLNLIDYAIKVRVNTIYSFVMTPFPCTEVWEIAKRRGKIKEDIWTNASNENINNPFSMDNESISYQNPLLLDDTVNKEDFKRIFLLARKKLNVFRYRFIVDSIIHNPIETMIYSILNLSNVFKSVTGILRGNK